MEDKNAQLVDLSQSPEAQFWKVPFEQLRPAEQVFLSIWELEAEVNNGGFSQYFSNSSGDTASHIVTALNQIGAKKFAAIAGKAIAVFGTDGPPANRELRSARLEQFTEKEQAFLENLDQEFLKYPDNLTELLYDFVIKNRGEIRGLN